MKIELHGFKSIAVTWFASYTAVMALPLCVFVIFSLRFMSVFKTETEYFNALSIKQVQHYLDTVVKESSLLSERINDTDEMQRLLSYSKRAEIPVLEVVAAQEQIRKTLTYVQGIDDFYVYCPAFDLIIGKSSYAASKIYFDSYFSSSSFLYEQWKTDIADRHPAFRLVNFSFKSTLDAEKAENKILFVRPLNFIPRDAVYANLVIVLDRSILQPVKSKQFRNIFIADVIRHLVIYENSDADKTLANELPDRIFEYGQFAYAKKIDGTDYILAGIDSEAINWKYLAMEESSVYFGSASFIQRTAIFCFIGCLVLSLFLVTFLTRQSYKPVDDMVRLIARNSDVSQQGNEFHYISNAIDRMQADKDYLVKNQSVTELIQRSGNRHLPSRAELTKRGIVFQSNLFAVVAYKLLSHSRSPDGREKVKAVVAKAFFAKSILVYFFDVGEYVGAVLNIPSEKKSDEMYEQIRICIETIRRLENASVPAACSNIVSTYFDLHTAFVQAIDTACFQMLIPDNRLYFYKDMISYAAGHTFDYPPEAEVKIMEELKKGNEGEVMACIDKILEQNQKVVITPKSARFLFFNIAGTIIKVFSRFDEKLLAMYPDIALYPIFEDTTFQTFRENIQKITHEICEVLRHDAVRIQNKEEFSLYGAILSYINGQYENINLSVNLIADELSISPASLSRLFKKYNGECISDYINSVRIAHAKQLLKTGATLSEVARKSGFGSLRTFMRVFKNRESITPGQYEIMVGGK